MDFIVDMFSRAVEQLIGRASGPLHLRLVIMPTVVSIFAVRAGLRDARGGQPTFLWTLITKRGKRGHLLRSAAKDVGKIFIVAVVLDTIYQLAVLKEFRVLQLLIVAVGCAIVPYVLIRGPAALITRGAYRLRAESIPTPTGRQND